MISFHNVSKSYGKSKALDNISVSVNRGELFGLIGPDGAGKSTAMRMLVTVLLPDEGSITVNGVNAVDDYRQIRQIVGYMPGNFSLYTDLTVEENLEFFASVFSTSIKDNYHLIAGIYDQLAPFKNRKAGALSGGMKQKLALCCALIHRPLLLVLDDPTTGVDAVSRKEFWHMLESLRDHDITIMVSTPYLEEASLCDRVGLISSGHLLQIDTPQGIIERYSKKLWSVSGADNNTILNIMRALPGAQAVYPYRDAVRISTDAGMKESTIREHLAASIDDTVSVTTAAPDIEDCFMDLMLEQAQ